MQVQQKAAPGGPEYEFPHNDHLAQYKVTHVTGTMSSTANTNVIVSYPTGYTMLNCAVIGWLNAHTNGTNWYSNNHDVQCITAPDGVRVQTSNSSFLGTTFKVLLMKIPS